MKRAVIIYGAGILVSAVAGIYLYLLLASSDLIRSGSSVEITLDADRPATVQLFTESNHIFSSKYMQEARIPASVKNHTLKFTLEDVPFPGRLRIDLGSTRGKWTIHSVTLKGPAESVVLTGDSLYNAFVPNSYVDEYRLTDGDLHVNVGGFDASLVSRFNRDKYFNVFYAEKKFHPEAALLAGILTLFLGMAVVYRIKRMVIPSSEYIYVAYIGGFVLIICIPLFLMQSSFRENDLSENREKIPKPEFRMDQAFHYPGQYTAYFEDNFGMRKELITLNSYLRMKLFHVSANPRKVLIGKNSWLYPVDPEIAGDFHHADSFSEDELQVIRKNLEEISSWHRKRNVQFYVFIAPSKFSIYPEYLPERIHVSNKVTKAEQLVQLFAGNPLVKIITAHDELKKAKKDAEVFYAHDTHWNFTGGFIGYQVLMAAIQKDFPQLAPAPENRFRNYYKKSYNADLSKQLSLENVLRNDEWIPEYIQPPKVMPGKENFYPTVFPLQPTLNFEHSDTSLPRMLIYRDSYTNLMIPYLVNHFSRSVFLWTHEFSAEVTDTEKPDIVIMEIIETHLDKLLESNPVEFRQ
jgi:hypothetical protein